MPPGHQRAHYPGLPLAQADVGGEVVAVHERGVADERLYGRLVPALGRQATLRQEGRDQLMASRQPLGALLDVPRMDEALGQCNVAFIHASGGHSKCRQTAMSSPPLSGFVPFTALRSNGIRDASVGGALNERVLRQPQAQLREVCLPHSPEAPQVWVVRQDQHLRLVTRLCACVGSVCQQERQKACFGHRCVPGCPPALAPWAPPAARACARCPRVQSA